MKQNEFKDLMGVTTGTDYLTEPCVSLCEITDVKSSDNEKDYKGAPYYDVSVTLENGKKSTIRFWRPKDGDSEKAKEFKLKRLKEFLTNAEADFTEPSSVMKSIIKKRVFILFRQEEYIGKDKDFNNRPVIKKKIDMNFSSPEYRPIEGNQSYFYKPLNDEMQKKFEAQLQLWQRENGESESKQEEKTEGSNNDLPF